MDKVRSLIVFDPGRRRYEHGKVFGVNDDTDTILAESTGYGGIEADETLLSASNILVAVVESWLLLGSVRSATSRHHHSYAIQRTLALR